MTDKISDDDPEVEAIRLRIDNANLQRTISDMKGELESLLQQQDHLAQARRLMGQEIELRAREYFDRPSLDQAANIALAHATIALAEQQRLANLIAWYGQQGDSVTMPPSHLRKRIWEGLGIL